MPLVVIAICLALVMSLTHVPPFETVFGPGYTTVATQGTYGIIIDERFATRFVNAREGVSFDMWTPSRDDISTAEELLRPYRPDDALDRRTRSEFDSPEEAVSRTWFGSIVDGERLLFVNGYCAGGLPAQPLIPIVVSDGGACYWNATIDATAWVIITYRESGEA